MLIVLGNTAQYLTLFIQLNAAVQFDERIKELPKVYKDLKVYFTTNGELVAKSLI